MEEGNPRMPTTWRSALTEMNRRIEEAERLSSAQAVTVAAIARAGGDATEAVQDLYAQMDQLTRLRQERQTIEHLAQGERGQRGFR